MLYDYCMSLAQANRCQCQRLGARLAALKKPMVAVHKGRQTADDGVLATIKELVTDTQQFMERCGALSVARGSR